MSTLVLHMSKFKKDAIRGIQSHNRRERESHSNPDIDYSRSVGNYDLHESASDNYAQAIQNRIDDLLMVKAVRKDAVHMCGLIVSSDKSFFTRMGKEETRRFFAEAAAYLTDFVGKENVISAMVHMDEKTPHMHFLHVPVTQDGRLSANSIYSRASLKKLQTELPSYLQSRGFEIQRGVEQKPGSAKKHLDTREFKQQQESLAGLRRESDAVAREALQLIGEMIERRKQEEVLQERLQSMEQQAREAEAILSDMPELPQASLLNYKFVLKQAQTIMTQQQKSLAEKTMIAAARDKLQAENKTLEKRLQELSRQYSLLKAQYAQEQEVNAHNMRSLMQQGRDFQDELEEYREFTLQPEIMPLHAAFLQEKEEQRQREEEEQQESERQEEEARQQSEYDQHIRQEPEVVPQRRRPRMR
ncbi:MobV family relaxase [Bilophila wadsworthia]|uniref:MobV family relaxase n=1 Tax=Bilophila wadsworthia TaxID=35833 RepID=UPI0039F5B8E8